MRASSSFLSALLINRTTSTYTMTDRTANPKLPVFLLLHICYDLAKLLHSLLANPGEHNLACFKISAFFIQLDGLAQQRKLFLFQASKLQHLSPLLRTVLREAIQFRQPHVELGSRCLIWLQIGWIVCNEVSALACFCVHHELKNGAQLLLDFVDP